jgi:hypothetical protein
VFFIVIIILTLAVGIINMFIDPLFWILRCPVENKLQKVEETHPKRRLRSQQLSIRLRKAVSERFNKKSLEQYFSFQFFQELFYKNEEMITLSSRLVNWHDMIAPSLAKLENDFDFHEKVSFVNQRGTPAAIDTKGLLFTSRNQKLSTENIGSENGFTIHHFMHQLKLQHSQLVGDRRKIFEESWR